MESNVDLKNINIGSLIEIQWKEMEIHIDRTCNFLNCTEEEVYQMFGSKSLDSEILLRWSKLLEYDFFRIYSQHLILFSPPTARNDNKATKSTASLPLFRKNIYTKELIDFIIELLEKKVKTKLQIIEEYRIPKTTLHTWIKKYSNLKE